MSNKFSPMLAEPFTKAVKRGVIGDFTHFALEQKYDGIRLVVYRGMVTGDIDAFTRPRDNGTRFISQRDKLSPRLLKELSKLPYGYVIDGELLNGDVSTDVKRRDILDGQSFVVFDLLALAGSPVISFTYDERREALDILYARVGFDPSLVRLAPSTPLKNEAHFKKLRDAIWRSGKEGVVLKRRSSVYHAGKRTLDWIKVKKVEHDALEVIGFERSRGDVMNRGRFAIVRLRGSHPNPKTWPTVKTLNDEQLDKFNLAYGGLTDVGITAMLKAQRRMLVIEHFGRTREGGYRGPVLWDRWEDE